MVKTRQAPASRLSCMVASCATLAAEPTCGILNHIVSAELIPVPNATSILEQWNTLPAEAAAAAILPCCGSHRWATALAAARPIANEEALLSRSDTIWRKLSHEDWQQAFDSHPRLGEAHAKAATAASLTWSQAEQRNAAPSDALREANARYERKFGRIFLFCANGRTSPAILSALEERMHNDAATEWREAGEQQRQITRLRLQRWLRGS